MKTKKYPMWFVVNKNGNLKPFCVIGKIKMAGFMTKKGLNEYHELEPGEWMVKGEVRLPRVPKPKAKKLRGLRVRLPAPLPIG